MSSGIGTQSWFWMASGHLICLKLHWRSVHLELPDRHLGVKQGVSTRTNMRLKGRLLVCQFHMSVPPWHSCLALDPPTMWGHRKIKGTMLFSIVHACDVANRALTKRRSQGLKANGARSCGARSGDRCVLKVRHGFGAPNQASLLE